MEIWKDAKYIDETGKLFDYTEYYQVSSYGRVRGLDRCVIRSDGQKRHFKGGLIQPQTSSNGYLQVSLYKNGVKICRVHRLVASTFPEICGKWFEGADVNHKIEKKELNIAANLEWVSHSENCNYGFRNKKVSMTKSKNPVLQFDLGGNFIKEWLSAREIEKQLGYNHSNIAKCCKGKYKTFYGYKWQYKEERAA